LAHGVTVNVRLAGPGDEHALLDFYRTLPLEDRLFLKDDVTTDGWATRFMRRIACGEVRSLIAERDGRVVAEATLARATHGWSVHVAELRVAVARIVRRQGLGSALAGLLVEMAIDEGVDKLVVQVVEHQVAALQVFRKLGFQPEAVLRRHVRDVSGTRRDLLVLANDLSHAWIAMEALIADIPPEVRP
jgi:RimJ/RimL family protein N-acetyltransferase